MRILICEDSALLREGLVRLLEDAGHTVVAALVDPSPAAVTSRRYQPRSVTSGARSGRRSPTASSSRPASHSRGSSLG